VCKDSKLEPKINAIKQSILKKSGKNLVIIFDGYNELPHRVCNSPIIASIIKRNYMYLKSHLLIITSRPSGSDELHPYACRRVEVLS